ncbi:MAG: Methylated-DNA--protein-cysteine methyltransferase [Methanonatronarchaeales archaeon]|nr:Methylated-DNA--protein-cysteine methyltransferase [Methanonatronarchaeales archaeon]
MRIAVAPQKSLRIGLQLSRVKGFLADWRGWWFCVLSDCEVRAVSMFRGSPGEALSAAEEKAGSEADAVLRDGGVVDELRAYLESREPLSTAAEPRGTGFQGRVWGAVSRISLGETRTYGEVASEIDGPGAARAVGNALGVNPAPLFVPCHRVVSRSGLGGFSGGTDLKRFLLKLEGVRL